jgi:predicted FMN-binding regulatory protein PaiB
MIHYKYYEVPDAEARAFAGQCLGARLVTVQGDGMPAVGTYPFLLTPAGFEVHLPSGDEQLEHLKERPRAALAFGDVLTFVPSYWEDERSALGADLYHRSVVFEVTAELVREPEPLHDHLARLLARYQPEGRYEPPVPGHPMYTAPASRLTLARLTIVRVRTKYKLGQNRPPEVRRDIAARLDERGGPGDAAAAAAVRERLERGSA